MSVPTGAKMIAASSGSRWRLVGVADPFRPEARCEVLGRPVARPGEGMDALALVPRHLGHDVGRGAEAEDAEGLRGARHAVGAVADQPGAEEGGCVGVAVAVGNAQAEAKVGEHEVLVAPVEVAAGEPRLVAEVLLAGMAEAAAPAGAAEPRHADPLADLEAIGLRPHFRHLADDLVAGHHRIAADRQFPVDKMEVGAADPAGQHADEHLCRSRLRNLTFLEAELLARPPDHHRPHGAILPSGPTRPKPRK